MNTKICIDYASTVCDWKNSSTQTFCCDVKRIEKGKKLLVIVGLGSKIL